MKKVLYSLILTMSSMMTWAEEYNSLVVELSSGEKVPFVSSGLTLTYSDTELTVTQANGIFSKFSLNDLNKMYFSIEDLPVATGVEKVSAVEEGKVKVFTTDGALAGEFDSLSAAKKELPKGSYVVNSKTKNYKITIQ